MRGFSNPGLFIAAAASGYMGAAQITPWAAATLLGADCRAGLLSVACRFHPDGVPDWRVYAIAGAVVILTWAASVTVFKTWILYPFVVLFGALALGAMGYDLIFHNGLVSAERLVNDTFNVLRLLVFGSFALTFVMARRSRLTLPRVIAAVLLSYAASLAAMLGFMGIRAELFGAFELFVLYIVYAFGGFTLHLMTLSLLVSSARPAAVELGRAGRLCAHGH